MRILLTGATGYIGSAVLDVLVEAGHEVTAVVRSERAAREVAERGATAVQGDVTDVGWFTSRLAESDAAIHTAAPEHGAPAFNDAVIKAAIRAYGDGGRRFVLTSGIWEYGAGGDFADALLLDQAATGRVARTLGWVPEHVSVTEDARAAREASAA